MLHSRLLPTADYAPLAAFVSFIGLIALTIAASGCTPAARERAPVERAASGVLSSMGFGLVDDGDPSTSSGTLTASFDAPVLDANSGVLEEDGLGTAHVAFDDATRDIASAAIIGAYPDSDVVYAVLFEEDAPWRYVVVAAHAAAVVDGAVIALDGENAAALVVDEETGAGFLSASGALTIGSASLVDGGTWSASLDAGLVEVGLDTWPESLFPFTEDGAPSEQVPSTGSGTFDTSAGTADVTIDVEGFAPFTGGSASLEPADDLSSFIVITNADGRRAFVIFVENDALIAGTTMSLGGYTAGAALLEEDGTQLAFVDGTLTLDSVDTLGGAVTGSFTLSGDAYVIPADQWSGEGEGEPPFEEPSEEDCTGLDALAATFAPAQVYVQEGIPEGELPPGYDTVLTFTDGNIGMLGVLVQSDAPDYEFAFSTVDYEGASYPAAVLGLATCSSYVDITNGTLDAEISGERMVGTLTYLAGAEARTIAIDVEVLR